MNAAWLKFLPVFFQDKLTGRHALQSMLGNSGWLFADKVVRLSVGLFIGVWMARYLGPARFGQLNYAIAFVALFSAFATLGLDGIVVQNLVRNQEQKAEIIGSAFALKLMGGCVAFLLAIVAIRFVRPVDVDSQWLVGIIAAGMIFQSFDTADLWFQSRVQSKFTVIAKSSAFLVVASVKVWLILTRAELVAFAWAATAEIVLGAIGLSIAFRTAGNAWIKIRPAWSLMHFLLRDSWPLLLSGLAIMLYMRIDQVMLGGMVGEHEVGLYSAALRLSEVWYAIPIIVVSSVLPSLTEARARSQVLYYQRLQQLLIQLARVAYVVAIAMTFLAKPLVQFLYGESYSQSSSILAVHIWTALFVFMGVATTPWTLNEGTMKLSLYQTVLGAILNVGLNLYLIPTYGALGAALATLISQCISAWAANFFFKRNRQLFWMQTNSLLMGLVRINTG